MLPEYAPEQVEFRLAIIEAKSPTLLAEYTGGTLQLPTITVPGKTRPAEAITAAIEERWGIPTTVMAFTPPSDERSRCVVLELIRDSEVIPAALVPISLTTLKGTLTVPEHTLLEHVMAGMPVDDDPLFKLGWLKQIKQSIEEYLPSTFIGFSDDIKQLNLSGPFTLLRLGTKDGAAYWFKRVGIPNLHEFGITVELAKRFPDYVPQMVCIFPKWNAWVTKEVSGPRVSSTSDANQAEQALKSLARLQQESILAVDHLRANGARDATLPTVLRASADFFSEMTTAMAEQHSTKSRALEPDELRTLQNDVIGLLDEVIQLRVPDTLVHLDIGHGNVLLGPSGPIFLDWAEAFVGFPFVTAEHLVTDLEVAGVLSAAQLATLRRHYAQHWIEYASAAALERIVQLTPMIAVTTYAVIGWRERRRHGASQRTWPFLRSLTRRIHSEINRLPERQR